MRGGAGHGRGKKISQMYLIFLVNHGKRLKAVKTAGGAGGNSLGKSAADVAAG
jgi:hypothetical protein